jgi:hypothetical protein
VPECVDREGEAARDQISIRCLLRSRVKASNEMILGDADKLSEFAESDVAGY